MATISLLGGILFWLYIWNKWYRPRKPKPIPEQLPSHSPHGDEEREAIHNEVLLQMWESGESIEDAKIIAESIAQLYDKKKN